MHLNFTRTDTRMDIFSTKLHDNTHTTREGFTPKYRADRVHVFITREKLNHRIEHSYIRKHRNNRNRANERNNKRLVDASEK